MTRHFSARRVGRGIVKLGWVGTGETKHNCTLPSGLPLDETLFFRSRKKRVVFTCLVQGNGGNADYRFYIILEVIMRDF